MAVTNSLTYMNIQEYAVTALEQLSIPYNLLYYCINIHKQVNTHTHAYTLNSNDTFKHIHYTYTYTNSVV